MASGNDLFSLEQIEVEKISVDATLIFEEIHREIREYLTEELTLVRQTVSLTYSRT